MISYIIQIIKTDIKHCEDMAADNKRRMATLASYKGMYLSYGLQKGVPYYSYYTKADSKRKYLGRGDNVKVIKIQERKFREKWDKVLSKRIKLLNNCLKLLRKVDNVSPEAVHKSLSKNYRGIPLEAIRFPRDERAVRWVVEMERAKKLHPPVWREKLIHEANDGRMYRSKSEVIDANILNSMGIPYVPEAPLRVGMLWLHPDFTMLNPTSYEVVYGEHVGWMQDEGYRRRFADRMYQYLSNGIVPGVNLILFFEDADGKINTAAIERQIRSTFNI